MGNPLARWRSATETIEAVHIPHGYRRGSYEYGVQFTGGRHAGYLVRCHNEQSCMRMFDEAVEAHKQGTTPWWLRTRTNDHVAQ